MKKRVLLNVSGAKFETYSDTLQRFPDTVLGNAAKRYHFFDADRDEYFFNRCRTSFESILYFFQSDGKLLRPEDVPLNIFVEECMFYELPVEFVNQLKLKEGILPEKELKMKRRASLTIQLWEFLDNPQSSIPARWFAIASFILVWISILCACLETAPALKSDLEFLENPWSITELVLNTAFFLEFLLRICVCPSKKTFFRSVLNWVDACAVIPYFIFNLIKEEDAEALNFLRILKLVRVVGLLRLTRHSKRIQVIGTILKMSVSEFQLLFLCLTMVLVFCGSLMYFLEISDPTTSFTSIPEALWWAVTTITTVGYGDIVPTTVLGRIASGIMLILGAILILLPVISISARLSLFYDVIIKCTATE